MSFAAWWKRSSGSAKTITVLAAILLLQIGVCGLTPVVVGWYRSFVPDPSHDPFEGLALMALQAVLCIGTLIAMFCVWVVMGSTSKPPKITPPEDSND